MKVLILGAAGYVGQILRPAFLANHDTYFSDMNPIADIPPERQTTCDIEDVDKLRPAFQGMDSIIYLPYGRSKFLETHDVDLGFNVNVRAVYKCAKLAVDSGVPNFVHASSLSVYHELWKPPLDESRTPDVGHIYGLTKWLGEQVCLMLSKHAPNTTFLCLRLILPKIEKDWTDETRFDPNKEKNICFTGPNDIRRLFLAASALRKPGIHIVQATGDLLGKQLPNTRVKDLLDWEPRNE